MRTLGLASWPSLVAVAAFLAPVVGVFGAERAKEDQSAFEMSDGQFVSSSALIKLLKQKLGTSYQDLEIVMLVCESGEFATRAKAKGGGLPGTWSVTTAS